MRALQHRIHRHADLSHFNQSPFWTAGAVLAALAAIVVLFFFIFAMRAY